jgi:hypothetical protein
MYSLFRGGMSTPRWLIPPSPRDLETIRPTFPAAAERLSLEGPQIISVIQCEGGARGLRFHSQRNSASVEKDRATGDPPRGARVREMDPWRWSCPDWQNVPHVVACFAELGPRAATYGPGSSQHVAIRPPTPCIYLPQVFMTSFIYARGDANPWETRRDYDAPDVDLAYAESEAVSQSSSRRTTQDLIARAQTLAASQKQSKATSLASYAATTLRKAGTVLLEDALALNRGAIGGDGSSQTAASMPRGPAGPSTIRYYYDAAAGVARPIDKKNQDELLGIIRERDEDGDDEEQVYERPERSVRFRRVACKGGLQALFGTHGAPWHACGHSQGGCKWRWLAGLPPMRENLLWAHHSTSTLSPSLSAEARGAGCHARWARNWRQ